MLGVPAPFRSILIAFSGERYRVAAFHGQTLYEAAVKHKVQVGDLLTCHVILSPDTYNAYPKPLSEELEILEGFPERTPTSRMASFIQLDSSLPEPVVALGQFQETDIP